MGFFPSLSTNLFRSLSPEKQEKIFEAAVQEFASQGYRGASMNTLVREAGISKGSLFQYFRTKRNLFQCVVEIATGRVKQYLRQVRDQTTDLPFLERLERITWSGFAFIDQHPLLARIYFHLLQSGEAPFSSKRMLDLRREGDEFTAELLQVAADRGELRGSLDVAVVAFLINAALERLLRAYYTEFLASGLGLYRGNTEELNRWVRMTVDFARNGIENPERTEPFPAEDD